jgi:hypothetical protein
MWLFKKRKQKENNKPAVSDKVAGRIAGVGIKMQTKFSEFMNKLFSKMAPGKVKVFLVVFCLSAGGYSIYLFSNALFGEAGKQPSLNIEQANVPKHFDKTGDEMMHSERYVDDETYRQIIGFKYYMDSLKLHKRILHDSIMIARPGLMDSILALEEIYNSQQLK